MADLPIDVRVLSPIPEAEGGINFPSLPPSTTVRELKLKIRDALPSHPAPERMRIIYFGRVVQDSMGLGNVFHEENLQSTGRRGNLHMVLSEAPRSSTAPPNAAHPLPRPHAATATQRPQSQPPRADRLPDPAPNGLPNPIQQAMHQAIHAIHAGPMAPPPGGPVPPHIHFGQAAPNHNQEAAAEALRAMDQVFRPRPPTHGRPFQEIYRPLDGGQTNGPQQGAQSSDLPSAVDATEQAWRRLFASNRQRAGGDHAGEQENRTRYTVEASFAAAPPNAAGLPPVPIAYSSNMPMHAPGQRSMVFSVPQHPAGTPIAANIPLGPQAAMAIVAGPPHAHSDFLLQQIQGNMSTCQSHVLRINEELFPTGTSSFDVASLTPDRFQRAATQLERVNLLLNSIHVAIHALVSTPEGSRSREVLTLQMENERMRSMTRRLIQSMGHHITSRRRATNGEAPTERPNPQADHPTDIPTPMTGLRASTGTPQAGTVPVGAQRQPRPNAYQLIAPDGTRSILYSAQPTFVNVSPGEWYENMAYQRALRDLVQLLTQNQGQPIDTSAVLQQNRALAALAQVPLAGDQVGELDAIRALLGRPAQQGQPAQPAQAPVAEPAPVPAQGPEAGPGNAAVPLGAIAAHFWLLLRIFGMLWLFSGSGWRRTLMMAFCGLVVYVFQAGIFGAVLGDRIDGFRRHFEALVGVPPQPGAQAGNGQNPNDGHQEANADEAPRRRRREPSPEEVAQRILREREDQRRTWFRDTIQGAERLVALFVASLWPGLGERMVAAREEAEAQARRDTQDREERRQRELQEEQRAQREPLQSTEAADTTQQTPQPTAGADVNETATATERADESTAPANNTSEGEQERKVDKGKCRAVETDSEEATVATGSSEPSSAAGSATRRQAWSSNQEE
ncbi:hypothetical protein IWX90DRAFT_27226 [Phyllosticta citrichinensis]|uniref:Ubiquitin-like domain-containing protein n=1 Tax=Phyllosticta citrichinensis TaxID=1130410 RepID=A0ABR1Y7F1_9PEZI